MGFWIFGFFRFCVFFGFWGFLFIVGFFNFYFGVFSFIFGFPYLFLKIFPNDPIYLGGGGVTYFAIKKRTTTGWFARSSEISCNVRNQPLCAAGENFKHFQPHNKFCAVTETLSEGSKLFKIHFRHLYFKKSALRGDLDPSPQSPDLEKKTGFFRRGFLLSKKKAGFLGKPRL